MKNYYAIFCLGILLITSCTKTLYTQQQVLNTYKTKSDVTARFGLPGDVKANEDKTTSYYYYGNQLDKIAHKRLQSGDPLSKNNNRAFIDIMGKPHDLNDSSTTYFNKYLKFTFSGDNKVIGSEAKGLFLSVSAPAPGKTTTLVLVVTTTILGLVASSMVSGLSNMHF